ncbi:MAG: PilZ domain-containing protein [Marinobacter sp.]|nr:PilZ domain-containing protein [Marinobacter sp.]
MNTASVAPHFVHESDAQQQYARINIPAWLHVNLDGRAQKFPVADLSAAGFSVSVGPEALRLRQVYNGHLVFEVDGFDVPINVNFVPRSFDSMNDRCGCEFQNLGHREFSALRYLITASLSGEVVFASDVLNTLSREDVEKVRKGKGGDDPGFFGMPRAMIGSVIVMLVVLFAVSFVTSALSDIYFMTETESEAVATFDEAEWANGEDLVGGDTYSVSQVGVASASVDATDPLSIEGSGRATRLTGDPLWEPSLQNIVVLEPQSRD